MLTKLSAVLGLGPLVVVALAARVAPRADDPTAASHAAPAPPSDAARAPPSDAAPLRYDRDVRPLLADRCFKCHGPDEKKRRAKLRLDDPASACADRDGSFAIVPGDPDASELLERVGSDDPKRQMPPPNSNKKPLTADEQAIIRRWIEQGAHYEPHWSFVAPLRPPLPAVADEAWSRNPIDRFIAAPLEQQGIALSPLAEPEVQLRRLFLDLTGLPPTPEEIAQFADDPTDESYARFVDRIFEEEPWRSRYAERMATPWLDQARYADTCGIHTDAGRQMWAWRDWVLNAYRDDLPFDRFVVCQIAGDLLPGATEADRIASGFERAHITTDEGGAIAEEYLVEYAVDRTATTGSVFLGLTFGCARCHDHKFDPITQEDFYGLYAYFNSIEEPGLYSQLPDPNRAFEPAIKVPSREQKRARAELDEKLARAREELDRPAPEELALERQFLDELHGERGARWAPSVLVSAASSGGATLTPQPDGSVLASGENPARDDHEIVLRTEARDLRLLALEAIPDASLPEGRIGRAPNGNAVLTGVELEAVSVADPSRRRNIRFGWAVADHEQDNGDHRVVNVLDTGDDLGWAVDAHRKPGGRVVLLLADEPFGFEGGSELHVKLQYRSVYAQHTLGRVRASVGQLATSSFDRLPTAVSGWYVVGPFSSNDREALFDAKFGPEDDPAIDLTKNFGAGNQFWRFDPGLVDGRVNELTGGVNVSYVARRLFAPTARKLEVSLGSDDGFRLFVNGVQVAANRIDRAPAPDQDRATFDLAAGANVVVFKIVNTGGGAGFYWRELPRPAAAPEAGELVGDLVFALLPESGGADIPGEGSPDLVGRIHEAWRRSFSPGYRQGRDQIAALEKSIADLDDATPQTMVMQELPAPRPTFILMRGEYDKPDPTRPVQRAIPPALGRLPEGAPNDRLGLAQWLVSQENPLVARVAVNRWWEMLFGLGLVKTSEDFGLQGEWPSHPELLDWLAVELRDGGGGAKGPVAKPWDLRHLLKLMVTSNTYRQSARVREEVREHDPENRWLSWFPRRRLGAEQIRDQALYVGGLLVERFGGPSVKPYQPDGLWTEVAMPASNTRNFVRGQGDDLWRRSVYTYWKRACPPPALQTFDAPTREFCTIRRTATNTPLQALVLWNDEQFVESARALAQRTLAEPGDDASRLARMHERCTSRRPDAREAALLATRLNEFRRRYEAAPADAEKLAKVGMTPVSQEVSLPELAAWTLIASVLLNLDATLSRS